MCARWFGSKYERQQDKSLRDRHSGIIYTGVKKIDGRYVGVGKKSYEPVRKHYFGRDLPNRKIPNRFKR